LKFCPLCAEPELMADSSRTVTRVPAGIVTSAAASVASSSKNELALKIFDSITPPW
jgi:hypothetical protein